MTETIAHDINKETLRLLSQVASQALDMSVGPKPSKCHGEKRLFL